MSEIILNNIDFQPPKSSLWLHFWARLFDHYGGSFYIGWESCAVMSYDEFDEFHVIWLYALGKKPQAKNLAGIWQSKCSLPSALGAIRNAQVPGQRGYQSDANKNVWKFS